jgi:aryl-alcohol dehydrogenase-like predicted oxidoreductase
VEQVHDNLRRLGLEALDVVNLRVGGFDAPEPGSIAEPFGALAELREQGLIRHLGLSTVDADQLAEAQAIAPVVCVQNFYNIANRRDDALVDSTARQGIAFVPYFPLGGMSPLQSETLHKVAARLGSTPMSVALAWLLRRSPNILLIPGTSSVAHLRENVAGAGLDLPADALAELESMGSEA